MPDLDLAVEAAVVHGQLSAGISPAVLASRASTARLVITEMRAFNPHGRAPAWTEPEDEFLRQNLGWLAEDEMAGRLGRTPVAVHLRWKRDLRLPAPSKAPDILTANQVAEGLGVDLHIVAHWIDSGLLPGRRLPNNRVMRVVRRADLRRWLVQPEHWLYFDPERIDRGPHRRAGDFYDEDFWRSARRLAGLAHAHWGDEWWRARQVADHHGVTASDVQRFIRSGRIAAVQVRNLSGRHADPHWAPWFVRRSEATRADLVFTRGKGSGHEKPQSRAADAFLVLARAVGLSVNAIAAMGYPGGVKNLFYRWAQLERKRLIPGLVREFGLKVVYRPRAGALFADWRDYRDRFPRLARALQRFQAGDELGVRDLCYVRGVLQKWAAWHARTPAQRKFARSLITPRLDRGPARRAEHFRALHQQLRAWGAHADPLRRRSPRRRGPLDGGTRIRP
jgi:hypothetical protein